MKKCSVCKKEVSEWSICYDDKETPFCKDCYKKKEIKEEKSQEAESKSDIKNNVSAIYIIFLILNIISTFFVFNETDSSYILVIINVLIFGLMIALITLFNQKIWAIKILTGIHGIIAFFYLASIFVFKLSDVISIIGFILGMIIHLRCIRYLNSKFLNKNYPN